MKNRRGDYTSWSEGVPIQTNAGNARGHLLMAILNYRREIDHLVADAIEQAYWSLHIHHQWVVTKALYLGSADVADSRNVLASQFYYSDKSYTHMLCIDGDVSWEMGTVERLISHPVDLVLGAYPKRADGEGYPVKFMDRETPMMVNPTTGEPDPKGLVKLAGGPAGLMLLRRSVIDRFVEAYPERWYHHPKVRDGKALSLFEFEVVDHKRHSEDMNFCRLWREIGGDVWCDPHLTLHHHGDKTYSGKFADEMRLITPQAHGAEIIKIPA